MQDDILLAQELLNLEFPQTYTNVLLQQAEGHSNQFPVVGLPLSLEMDSVWGATEYLRACRPDLPDQYVVLRFVEEIALCLDINCPARDTAQVVGIFTDKESAPPKLICDTLDFYLENWDKVESLAESLLETETSLAGPWFQHGMERLDWHMANLSYRYNHKEGGQLPRSHVWRPYRFCVQDVILGITVVRHDRKYNRLVVDVFLTAMIPEYEPDSGCRSLSLILLSDAYKSGGTMEIKFTGHVEGGRVPAEICRLAKDLGVGLSHIHEGGLSPAEAKRLYLALSGFPPHVAEKVLSMEDEGGISAASVCYAMHHGVWTMHEIEMILFCSRFPDTLLTGYFPAEAWHLYSHDLLIGRNAVLGSFLDRRISQREHSLDVNPGTENRSVVELEDDERNVSIEFDNEFCAKKYTLAVDEDAVDIPWWYQPRKRQLLEPGQTLWVLLRARDIFDLEAAFEKDLSDAVQVKQQTGEQVCVFVPGDIVRLSDMLKKFHGIATENGIGIILCPEFIIQLDSEVQKRFETVKVLRQ